jgi:hypothetical protein
MQRICTSLSNAGYTILLVGRKLHNSIAANKEGFKQKRLRCLFNSGPMFYTEYNLRLFFYLLFVKMDTICAIDLDTILPCYFVSVLRKKKRVYDAHELFTEMKEIITRPSVKKVWNKIERFTVPKFKSGYTVSYSIANEFKKRYGVAYEVICNMPAENDIEPSRQTINEYRQYGKFVLYQGAVNEARGLENLIIAMKDIDAVLLIYGDGNIYKKIEQLITETDLESKVLLKGKVVPQELAAITEQAYIGINLVEPIGLNQLYSLANKFFDYIQACVPQVTMNFPEYKRINDEFEVAVLIDTIHATEIVKTINFLLNDIVLYNKLKNNCTVARAILNWQQEEKKLITFYNKVFAD